MGKGVELVDSSAHPTLPNDPAHEVGELHGRRCTPRIGSGVFFLVIGILTMISAALFAAGLWGTGVMYIVGGGLAVVAIVPSVVAAVLLIHSPYAIKDRREAERSR